MICGNAWNDRGNNACDSVYSADDDNAFCSNGRDSGKVCEPCGRDADDMNYI